jgi:hypothetical protein
LSWDVQASDKRSSIVFTTGQEDKDSGLAEANARLIALAPEMAKLIGDVVKAIDLGYVADVAPERDHTERLLRAGIELLARARGKES